jgi:hypothetical protein
MQRTVADTNARGAALPACAQQRTSGPRRSLNWAPVAVPWLIAELAEPGLTWGDITLLWTRFFSFEYRGFLMVVMGLTNQQIIDEDLFADADDRARACGFVVSAMRCDARCGCSAARRAAVDAMRTRACLMRVWRAQEYAQAIIDFNPAPPNPPPRPRPPPSPPPITFGFAGGLCSQVSLQFGQTGYCGVEGTRGEPVTRTFEIVPQGSFAASAAWPPQVNSGGSCADYSEFTITLVRATDLVTPIASATSTPPPTALPDDRRCRSNKVSLFNTGGSIMRVALLFKCESNTGCAAVVATQNGALACFRPSASPRGAGMRACRPPQLTRLSLWQSCQAHRRRRRRCRRRLRRCRPARSRRGRRGCALCPAACCFEHGAHGSLARRMRTAVAAAFAAFAGVQCVHLVDVLRVARDEHD